MIHESFSKSIQTVHLYLHQEQSLAAAPTTWSAFHSSSSYRNTSVSGHPGAAARAMLWGCFHYPDADCVGAGAQFWGPYLVDALLAHSKLHYCKRVRKNSF